MTDVHDIIVLMEAHAEFPVARIERAEPLDGEEVEISPETISVSTLQWGNCKSGGGPAWWIANSGAGWQILVRRGEAGWARLR